MQGTRTPVAALLAVLLLVPLVAPAAHHRLRRQLADDDSLQPLDNGTTSRGRARVASTRPHTRPIRAPVDIGAPVGTAGPRSSSQSITSRPPRQATTTDGIPEFDRNKVSLDFPGNLFGPSVSLLIRTTKIIGDVIQNSAVRYQSFLRLFQPLFKGQFEIKGLDPPTTTTTTTTTTTRAPAPADNEVRRR